MLILQQLYIISHIAFCHILTKYKMFWSYVLHEYVIDKQFFNTDEISNH